ncbi:MAG: hypothetical protein CMK09_04500 [Ponticaulis sp.]|nr:hypothetical protein [Ponticaulis sp.]|tara:strand:- start:45249 stop:46343 length:1095 start_codon:yes stop_codon:yes gene_type:complete
MPNQISLDQVRSVVFTGDIIRTGYNSHGPNQNVNIGWLERLWGVQLTRALGVPGRILRSLPSDGFDINYFYSLLGYGTIPSADNWARVFGAEELPEAAASYVMPHFENTLVASVELPEVFLNLLDRIGTPYFDITFHPVRFGSELILGIRTNVKECAERLATFCQTEDQHFVEAAMFPSLNPVETVDLKPGALIAGQTLGDRVSIESGRFVGLADYSDQLGEILEKYENVYYKRHPLVRNDHDMIKFLSGASKIRFISDNIYDLMLSDSILHVTSLCSGVSVEAKYFKKDCSSLKSSGNYFYEMDAASGKLDDLSRIFYSIKTLHMSTAWWRHVLLGEALPHMFDDLSSRSPVRDTLKQKWGLK